jgi:plastocyanin
VKRQIALIVLILALAGVGLFGSRASGGGGGCYEKVSRSFGSHVAIDGFCFDETVLFVEPGSEVTWTNRDTENHNVSGVNGLWGSAPLRAGGHVSYRFPREGVFPYICQFHMGMTGAVVVGDGVGAEKISWRSSGIERTSFSKRDTFSTAGADAVTQAPLARQEGRPAKQFEPDGGEWFYVFLLALGAVFMVALIVLGLSRRRRP